VRRRALAGVGALVRVGDQAADRARGGHGAARPAVVGQAFGGGRGPAGHAGNRVRCGRGGSSPRLRRGRAVGRAGLGRAGRRRRRRGPPRALPPSFAAGGGGPTMTGWLLAALAPMVLGLVPALWLGAR